jgi:hypothetical protein
MFLLGEEIVVLPVFFTREGLCSFFSWNFDCRGYAFQEVLRAYSLALRKNESAGIF